MATATVGTVEEAAVAAAVVDTDVIIKRCGVVTAKPNRLCYDDRFVAVGLTQRHAMHRRVEEMTRFGSHTSPCCSELAENIY